MKSLTTTILILLLSFKIHTQNQWVIYSPGNSGLPSNMVGSILIDSNNVKWITTSSGLAKFNGNNWFVYDTTNSGLPANACGKIIKDKQNNIWITVSSKGVVKYDGFNWIVYNYENTGFPINTTFSIAIDSSNNKWLGGIGLHKFNDTSWVRYHTGNSGIPGDIIFNVFANDNIIWIGTSIAGVGRFDGQNWTTYNVYNSGLPSNEIHMIKSDIYNNIWFSTFGGGVSKFKYSQNIWTVYNTSNSGLHTNNTHSIYVDNNNIKWIGASGCAVFNDTTWQIFPYSFIGDVFNFAKDRHGNMWICCTRGLYVYNPTGVVGVENVSTIVPENFLKIKNYPNPFNSETKIEIVIPKRTNLRLTIYDINGKLIKTVGEGNYNKGNYMFDFNGNNLASGIYFIVLKTDKTIKTHKIVLQK